MKGLKNSTFAKRLAKAMEIRSMTQTDLHNLTKINKSSISTYLKGEYEAKQDKVDLLSRALRVSPAWLMGYDISMDGMSTDFDETTLPGYIPISKRKIPLLGTVAAGEPIFADENIEEYLPIDDTIHADFALHVKGNSMIGANIHDGDIVLVRKQNDVDDGQIGIVLKDDEATMKRVYHGKDHLTLIAENPDYAPIICSAETCTFCKILGLVTHVIHKFV